MALINKRLAIFLVQCGFAIFLGLDQMIVDGSKAPLKMFTTRPKNKEIFVGDSVVFNWDYKQEDELDKISFGIVSNGSEGKNIALFVKRADGIIYMNSKYPRFKEILPRIKTVEGKRASFRIDNVRMNDTGKFFCTISKKGDIRTDTDYVDLKVVDLQIDEKASRSEEESWKDQKISLVCVARVVKNTPVTFTWLRQSSNETLSRGKHIDTRTESILRIITSSEQQFTTYTCVAKTKRTTKLHKVLVRQLYAPGPPLNLQQEVVFDKERGESYHKIFWSKPKDDGGAEVTEYIIEYKPRGIDWSKATKARTKDREYDKFKLKEGKLYDVRVLAKNKVNKGGHSNEVQIKLTGGFPLTGARSNSSGKVYLMWWSCLLSLTLLFIKL